MLFSRAELERNREDFIGFSCWTLMDLMLKLIADDRVKTQYCTDISRGDPERKRA